MQEPPAASRFDQPKTHQPSIIRQAMQKPPASSINFDPSRRHLSSIKLALQEPPEATFNIGQLMTYQSPVNAQAMQEPPAASQCSKQTKLYSSFCMHQAKQNPTAISHPRPSMTSINTEPFQHSSLPLQASSMDDIMETYSLLTSPKRTSPEPLSTNDLLFAILKKQEAPRVDVESYDGDPLNYAYFISVFKEADESKIPNPRERLTRLMKYTTAEAHEAMKYCI
eukprot:TCONS_00046122-protein